MRNNRRILLAALLCLVVILIILPSAVFAETDEKTSQPFIEVTGEQDAQETEKTPLESVDLTFGEEPKTETPRIEPKNSVFDNNELSLGLMQYTISAGDTVYRKFVAPVTGTYYFYSLSTNDTYGRLLNSNKAVILTDDDGGYGRNFKLAVYMNADDTVYVGASYYSSTVSGSCTVVAEMYKNDPTQLKCGLNTFTITRAGETVYRSFTPTVTSQYTFSSAMNYDTVGFFAVGDVKVKSFDDDGGHLSNFSFTVLLDAGTTYWIGARFYSNYLTGSIPVIIERRTESTGALQLGLNHPTVPSADATVYSAFSTNVSGDYRFMGVVPYSEGGSNPTDTFGTVADSGKAIVFYDDDSGYKDAFRIENVHLDAGDTCWLGVRYYSNTLSGQTTVLIERAIYRYASLSIGSNNVPISTAGDTVYAPFQPTETGTYTFYSTGSADTVGTLMDSNNVVRFYNDDGGEGRNFRFKMNMTAGETYFIGARYYDNAATGTIRVIVEKAVPFDGTIEWNSSDVQYKGTTPYVIANGSAQTPRFTVKSKNGSVIDPSHYTYEYRENVNAGTGYVVVTFRDTYSDTAIGWFKIYLPATTQTSVENIGTGIQIRWAAVPGAAGYVIYRRAWSSTTNGWTTFARWNNTTDLTWTDMNVYAGSRYQYGIKAYFARRIDPVSGATIGGNVGDNYNLGEVGPLKTTVRITTRKLKSLKAGNQQITVNWEGSTAFTGYEIQSATDAAFTQNAKTTKITDPKTYSTTLKSLKNNTEYFVRVRSYHVFEGMTYYGQWSNVLSVKPGSGKTVKYVPNKALVIGEGEYNGTASNRAAAAYDVNTMSGMLRSVNERFETTVQKNLTRDEIVSAIRSAYTGTTSDSVSVFFFSGHGSHDYYGTGGLYAVDGQTLTYKDLAAELNGCVKGRVIVILSCCHSGASINKSPSDHDDDTFLAEVIEAFSGYTLESNAETRTGDLATSKFLVIAAAPAAEVSWSANGSGFDGSGYPQSALTAALMRGVGAKYPDGSYRGFMPADTNADGKITLIELYQFAYETVYNWTENLSVDGSEGPQHVQYYGPDNAVLFTRN